MQLLIDVHLCSSCGFDEVKKENKIGLFFYSIKITGRTEDYIN